MNTTTTTESGVRSQESAKKDDRSGPVIDFPTREEEEAALADFARGIRAIRQLVADALPAAREGIEKLVDACRHKTNQSYHIRALLYSLWNGKPASLLEIVNLDRELREALLAVMRVFGSDEFFYDEIADVFEMAGLREWFLEEEMESGVAA